MKKLFIANWKMSVGTTESAITLARIIHNANSKTFDVVVCPSFIHLSAIKEFVRIGAQNCSLHENGAYTGEVSAESLKDIGCEYVILGHSERRQYHNETDATIPHKITAVHRHKLKAVVCIGEPEDIYKVERTHEYLENQIQEIGLHRMDHSTTIIAYEPLWAIGTGRTPTISEVEATIDFIKKLAPSHKVLYGGSVNSKNISQFTSIKNLDGFLVGGASAKADELPLLLE